MLRKKKDLRYANPTKCMQVTDTAEDIITYYHEEHTMEKQRSESLESIFCEILESEPHTENNEEDNYVKESIHDALTLDMEKDIQIESVLLERTESELIERNHVKDLINPPLECLNPEDIAKIVERWESQKQFENTRKFPKFVVVGREGVYKLRGEFSKEVETFLSNFSPQAEVNEADLEWQIDLKQYLTKNVLKTKKGNVPVAETFVRKEKTIPKSQEKSKPNKKIEVLQKPKKQNFVLGLKCLFQKLKGRDKEKSRKGETSHSSEQNANYSFVGQKNQPLTIQGNHGNGGGGGGGEDPNRHNHTKKLPDDKILFEIEEEDECEEVKGFMNGKEVILKIKPRIPNFPEDITINLRGKTNSNSNESQDKFHWREDQVYRKTLKRKPMMFDDILGRKVARKFECVDNSCAGRKYIGYAVKPLNDKSITVRSFKYLEHTCQMRQQGGKELYKNE